MFSGYNSLRVTYVRLLREIRHHHMDSGSYGGWVDSSGNRRMAAIAAIDSCLNAQILSDTYGH